MNMEKLVNSEDIIIAMHAGKTKIFHSTRCIKKLIVENSRKDIYSMFVHLAHLNIFHYYY